SSPHVTHRLFGVVSYDFLFTATATTELYTLSLHAALPISPCTAARSGRPDCWPRASPHRTSWDRSSPAPWTWSAMGGWCWCSPACCTAASSSRPCCSIRCCPCSRSEEHTSELQSRENLVCRLLLE